MPTLRPLPVVALLLAAFLVPACRPEARVVRRLVVQSGFVEPHTPRSERPEEMPLPPVVQTLLGPKATLNRVTTIRTRLSGRSDEAPRAVLLLIPGFLGGATTFDPLAADLVRHFEGEIEVWAVDRRPNQLEDRLGAEFALAGAESPACRERPPQPECALFQGAQFYSADADLPPLGDFPGPGDLDVDTDGVLDPKRALEDRFGVVRTAALVAQDDARFMAWWGLDTYFRDWKLLLEEARALVGEDGLVLLGGHSQGTTWASTFAAYDFDPDPAHVVAGHALLDGLVLLEGGGVGPPAADAPDLATYQASVAALATPGGPDVYLEEFGPIPLQDLATGGEVGALAAYFQPDEPALAQRLPVFASSLLSVFLGAPSTNRALVGFFLDDDFSLNGAFRASMGFSDDGGNFLFPATPPLIAAPFYSAQPAPGGGLRTWKEYDDPTLPSVLASPPCDPAGASAAAPTDPGCAIVDNGPPSAPGDPAPRTNGLEREVTDMDDFLRTQFGITNGFEWYFASGRPFLDFAFGSDSSALVAEHLATVDPGHEGPLVITRNAFVDVPVIAIGGSNGLTPEPRSFERYLASIATPPGDVEVHVLTGYAHLDVINAAENEAVPRIADFLERIASGEIGRR